MALFSTARQPQSSHLVEFRAGKMFTRGGGETGNPIMVHPDKRKGLVYIHQSDDTLMHFCWKDRTSSTVEDDLIVFPDDVEFVPVKECTTGRVFLLKFKSSTRKLFFWMQEPKTDKDEEYCRKVNELLNHPPPASAGRGGRGAGGQDNMDQFAMMNQLLGLGGSGGGGGAEDRMDLQNALAGMDHQQLMQLLNLMGTSGGGSFAGLSDTASPSPARSSVGSTAVAPPSLGTSRQSTSRPGPQTTTTAAAAAASTPAAATTAETSATGGGAPSAGPQQIQVSDLRNILANLSGTVVSQGNEPAIDLENVLTASNIEPSLRSSQNEARLLSHLPDEQPIQRSRQELLHTLRSPQFRQAVDMFGTALQTGQLAPLMSQFDLPPSAIEACSRGDVQSVAEILERDIAASASTAGTAGNDKDKEKKQNEKGSEPPTKKDKPDDEGMDLD